MAKRNTDEEVVVQATAETSTLPTVLRMVHLDGTATSLSPNSRQVLVETAETYSILDLVTGAFNSFSKIIGAKYHIALGSTRTSLVHGAPELPLIAVATTTRADPTVSMVFFFNEQGIPVRENLVVETPVHHLECGMSGLVVVVCGPHRRCIAVVVDQFVNPATTAALEAYGPVKCHSVIRGRHGASIDVLLDGPPPGATTNRFCVYAGPMSAWVPVVNEYNPTVLLLGGRAGIGTEIYSLEADKTIIELGIGHPPIVVPYAVESIVWLRRYVVLVIRDGNTGVPMLVPICKGSGAQFGTIFPDETDVGHRMQAQGGEGCLLVDGRLYMVE